MSARSRALKTVGVAAGVAAGVAGAAYGAQRALTRNLRNRPDPDAGRLGSIRFDEERRFPGHDGGSVYAVSRGSGPTFVLSHGVTIDSRVWIKQFDELPEHGVRIVAFDHRGHGQSSVGDTGHSLDNFSSDVRTVLEGMDLRDVILVGHSMGGVAAQAFVLAHPEIARERVRGLVLLSTFARTPFTALSSRGLGPRIAGWLDLAGVMRQPQLGLMVARLGFGREPFASHVELARRMLAECDPTTAREAVAALLDVDFLDGLSRIDCPTLVLSGTADVLTPPAEARRIAERIPGARLELLERAGHMLMLERTDELHALLLDFAHEVGVLPAAEAASA
ncbi:MAG: alpha/beta fold hydrolase [Acidimicrobiia bacterium]